MRKRLFPMVLAVTLGMTVTVFAGPTKMRELIAFTGLSAERLTRYSVENDLPVELYQINAESSNEVLPKSFDDLTLIFMPTADVKVDLNTFLIHEARIHLAFGNGEVTPAYILADDNWKTVLQSISAIAALEYDWTQDELFRLRNQAFGDTEENAYLQASTILFDSIGEIRMQDAATLARNTGERQFVYSGNYDYYIDYFVSQDNFHGADAFYRAFYLVAVARE